MQITWKQTLYQYFMVTLACIIMGVALNVFYMPNKMLSGGIGGVAVLAYYIGGLPMGATSLMCNVPLFFLAYKYMDRQYTIGALYGIVAFSISLDAFHFLSNYQVVHDKLLACIAGQEELPVIAGLPERVEVTTRTGSGRKVYFLFNNDDQAKEFTFAGENMQLAPFEMKVVEA